MAKLKAKCPLPALMAHLEMSQYNKKSCKSPFREDRHPSFSVYSDDSGYHWKDFGSDDGGDEVTFLARYLRLDEKKHFSALLAIYEAIATNAKLVEKATIPNISSSEFPDRSGFRPISADEIQNVSDRRQISIAALTWVHERGLLVAGTVCGLPAYAITDQSGRTIEARPLNQDIFPAVGELPERKTHSLKHTDKSFPVGFLESASYPCVALTEGMPDFLAAHDFILREQAPDGNKAKISCVPVAMLGSQTIINAEALTVFKNKIVRIFPHADNAGWAGAMKWKQQLLGAGAKTVDFLDLTAVWKATDEKVKDLNDISKHPELFTRFPALKNIMPKI